MAFLELLVLKGNFHEEDSLFVNMKATALVRTSKYFRHPMRLSQKLYFTLMGEDQIFASDNL